MSQAWSVSITLAPHLGCHRIAARSSTRRIAFGAMRTAGFAKGMPRSSQRDHVAEPMDRRHRRDLGRSKLAASLTTTACSPTAC
jgi:hypothetical protein